MRCFGAYANDVESSPPFPYLNENVEKTDAFGSSCYMLIPIIQMEPFSFTDLEKGDPRMCGRTFIHNGILVLVIRVTDGTIPDEIFDGCMAGLKRFASIQKQAPFKYHLVMDLHRTISLPVERMVTLNQYLLKKERVFRPNLVSTTYIVQGRITAGVIDSMFSMFGTWVKSKTLECYPTNGKHEHDDSHGIPANLLQGVLDFMDTEVLRKAQ